MYRDSCEPRAVDRPTLFSLEWEKMSVTERALTFEKHGVTAVVCKGQVYWRAMDVTAALEYGNGSQAVRVNVKPKHVKTLKQLREEASGSVSANLFIGRE